MCEVRFQITDASVNALGATPDSVGEKLRLLAAMMVFEHDQLSAGAAAELAQGRWYLGLSLPWPGLGSPDDWVVKKTPRRQQLARVNSEGFAHDLQTSKQNRFPQQGIFTLHGIPAPTHTGGIHFPLVHATPPQHCSAKTQDPPRGTQTGKQSPAKHPIPGQQSVSSVQPVAPKPSQAGPLSCRTSTAPSEAPPSGTLAAVSLPASCVHDMLEGLQAVLPSSRTSAAASDRPASGTFDAASVPASWR
jgi:hypothetical protein